MSSEMLLFVVVVVVVVVVVFLHVVPCCCKKLCYCIYITECLVLPKMLASSPQALFLVMNVEGLVHEVTGG